MKKLKKRAKTSGGGFTISREIWVLGIGFLALAAIVSAGL